MSCTKSEDILKKVPDKHGKYIDVKKASMGKLKAICMYYEGLAYRSNKTKDVKILESLLPDEYGIILNEIKERGSSHNEFSFLKTIRQL